MSNTAFDSSTFEENLANELAKSSLPHSIEAEQAVLGGLMLENNKLDAVQEVVGEGDFFREDHRLIFRMMAKLQEAGEPLDVITLSEELHKHGELDNVGGLGYLVEMANNTPSAANIVAYAKIVRERSTLRQLIAATSEISKSSFNPAGLDSDDLLQIAEKRIADIARKRVAWLALTNY
jgi:replicative DNA helicase